MDKTLPRIARLALAVALAVPAAAACAHDTWFAPLPDAGGERRLALGTGNGFPRHETAIGADYLRGAGCRGGGQALPLLVREITAHATVLAAPAAAASCWVGTTAFEIELPADKIDLYLDEVRPPQAVRDAWAELHARGLPWKERYSKHARYAAPGTDAAAAEPSGLAMDVLLQRDGPEHRFQLLRDGQPLPGFAVELRNDRSAIGLWRRTDAEGRLAFTPPYAGEWLLRGIDLRPSDTDPAAWDSRFVTLAFTVSAAVRTAAP